MTNIISHSKIVSFLDSVCSHVRAKKLHDDIREELCAHLEELVQENLANGMTEAEAVALAISRMGEPHQIGRGLDYTHRPRTDWLLIILMALLSGIGLLAMYSIQIYGTGLAKYINFFDQKMVHIGIGAVLMAMLWACDYQKIKKYSEYIFGFGVLLLVLLGPYGNSVNGQYGWYVLGGFSFYIPSCAILLMIVGCAGIKPLREHDWRGSILLIAYRGILPILLLVKLNSIKMAALYALIFIFYLWLTKRNAWQVIGFVSSSILLMTFVLISNNYMFSRAFGFLNLADDPYGSDYMITRFLETMHSAGWWGRAEIPETIRYPYSDGLIPSFINYFGWVAGLTMLILIAGFIVRIVIASTKIKENYGKIVFVSIGALFVLQFIWSVAMIFGYAPFAGISLPFVSYGGNDQIIQLALMGLLLGIYRRREMVPIQVS